MEKKEGLPVAGYTPQSQKRIDRVNKNKEMEERILRVCDEMIGNGDYDGRWVAIARTHFQQGFMALNRAVFQPERIKLPEDK